MEGKQYDTRYTAHVFNGSTMEHWNSPITGGTKYSFVLFSVNNSLKNDLKNEEDGDDGFDMPKLNTEEFFDWWEKKYDTRLKAPAINRRKPKMVDLENTESQILDLEEPPDI